jgi:hypothetical protein
LATDTTHKVVEDLSTIALTEFDAFTRFKTMAAMGDPNVGLAILDKLEQ